MTPVRLEPAAPRSRVKHSTTEPLRSLKHDLSCLSWILPYMKPQKKTLTISPQQSLIYINERGRHFKWSEDEYTHDVTNITCQQLRSFSYVQTLKGASIKIKFFIGFKRISTKSKVSNGSTRGPESIVVIIEHSPTFRYQQRQLDYAPMTPDHIKNTRYCQLNNLKVLS